MFVQGTDFPSVHRAGVQGLRGGAHGTDQPTQRLQGPRDPGTPVAKAGSDLVVLRDTLSLVTVWDRTVCVIVQNFKSL